MLHEVYEFNDKILKIDVGDVGPMGPDQAVHLFKAMQEEANEFLHAHENGDFIGQIDALVDSIYFAIGGFYKMGLPDTAVEEIFAAVHDANMTKKKGVVASRATGDVADAIKPVGWVPPEERIGIILDKYT